MPEVQLYENGKLTADGWRAEHAAGRSVLHNGRLYPPGSKIPSEAELASGNPAREQAAREALEAQMADLQHQMRMLGKNKEMLEPVGETTATVAHEGDERAIAPDMVGSVPPASGPDADPAAPSAEAPAEESRGVDKKGRK